MCFFSLHILPFLIVFYTSHCLWSTFSILQTNPNTIQYMTRQDKTRPKKTKQNKITLWNWPSLMTRKKENAVCLHFSLLPYFTHTDTQTHQKSVRLNKQHIILFTTQPGLVFHHFSGKASWPLLKHISVRTLRPRHQGSQVKICDLYFLYLFDEFLWMAKCINDISLPFLGMLSEKKKVMKWAKAHSSISSHLKVYEW